MFIYDFLDHPFRGNNWMLSIPFLVIVFIAVVYYFVFWIITKKRVALDSTILHVSRVISLITFLIVSASRFGKSVIYYEYGNIFNRLPKTKTTWFLVVISVALLVFIITKLIVKIVNKDYVAVRAIVYSILISVLFYWLVYKIAKFILIALFVYFMFHAVSFVSTGSLKFFNGLMNME